jgi:hypothetical protein
MGFFSRVLGALGGAGKAQSESSEVFRIVVAYVAALSAPRATVADVSRLPYPKPRIKEALIAAIGLSAPIPRRPHRSQLSEHPLERTHWRLPAQRRPPCP